MRKVILYRKPRKVYRYFDEYHGRFRVELKYRGGVVRSMYYSRYVMEKHLQRRLKPDEHVHHIDGNKLNDAIENLRVEYVGEHTKVHIKKLSKTFVCSCGKEFELVGKRLAMFKSNVLNRNTTSGPYCEECSKSKIWAKSDAQYFKCYYCGEDIVLEGIELSSFIKNTRNGVSKTGPYCNKCKTDKVWNRDSNRKRNIDGTFATIS